MPRVMLIYGTRPEAIKMAPLVQSLSETDGLEPVVAVTGQHREMLDQVNELFDIRPDHDLDVGSPRQSLYDITKKVLSGVQRVILQDRPSAIVVQGDTTSSFASALAAFYEMVPVIHLEAGLRTHELYSPFPEEMNRRLTSRLASLHLAPTSSAVNNLLREGVIRDDIVLTGNTVIDALLGVVDKRPAYSDEGLQAFISARSRTVLVTAHRRESWGEPMAEAAQAIAQVARKHSDTGFVVPAHLNPRVREVLLPPLQALDNIYITNPLSYAEFCRLMNDSYLIVTDSGGVQEEAPSLGKPVLVMRSSTERGEAVAAGVARLVGTSYEQLSCALFDLLENETSYRAMVRQVNPYGDGKAARRSAAAIAHLLGIGERSAEFIPVA